MRRHTWEKPHKCTVSEPHTPRKHIKGATIGPPAKCHSMAFRWWDDSDTRLYADWAVSTLIALSIYLVVIKETKSATMNIFRKFLFLFKSFVKAELS